MIYDAMITIYIRRAKRYFLSSKIAMKLIVKLAAIPIN